MNHGTNFIKAILCTLVFFGLIALLFYLFPFARTIIWDGTVKELMTPQTGRDIIALLRCMIPWAVMCGGPIIIFIIIYAVYSLAKNITH